MRHGLRTCTCAQSLFFAASSSLCASAAAATTAPLRAEPHPRYTQGKWRSAPYSCSTALSSGCTSRPQHPARSDPRPADARQSARTRARSQASGQPAKANQPRGAGQSLHQRHKRTRSPHLGSKRVLQSQPGMDMRRCPITPLAADHACAGSAGRPPHLHRSDVRSLIACKMESRAPSFGLGVHVSALLQKRRHTRRPVLLRREVERRPAPHQTLTHHTPHAAR